MLHKSVPGRICGSSLPSDQAQESHWQYWTQAGSIFFIKGTKFTFVAQLRIQFSFALACRFSSLGVPHGRTSAEAENGQVGDTRKLWGCPLCSPTLQNQKLLMKATLSLDRRTHMPTVCTQFEEASGSPR